MKQSKRLSLYLMRRKNLKLERKIAIISTYKDLIPIIKQAIKKREELNNRLDWLNKHIKS